MMADKVEIEDVLESMKRGFIQDVKPYWDEIEKHLVWSNGRSKIYDWRDSPTLG